MWASFGHSSVVHACLHICSLLGAQPSSSCKPISLILQHLYHCTYCPEIYTDQKPVSSSVHENCLNLQSWSTWHINQVFLLQKALDLTNSRRMPVAYPSANAYVTPHLRSLSYNSNVVLFPQPRPLAIQQPHDIVGTWGPLMMRITFDVSTYL